MRRCVPYSRTLHLLIGPCKDARSNACAICIQDKLVCLTSLNQRCLFVCVGTAAAQQERVWRFLEETSAWLYTLQIPRDAQKFAQLDLHRMQSSTSAVVVFMGAAQSRLNDVVRRNIKICALDSSLNPAVQQYALVGSIATLDTALREDTTVVSMCQKHGFTFLSVHTTDTPR